MKAIINWIVLIPVLVLAVGVEFFTALNPEGAQSFFGMDADGISEIIIISLVALFALFFILSLFDRKTSPVHLIKRNYVAGSTGVIVAFSLAGDTATQVAEAIRGTGMGAMDIIVSIVSAFAAVTMLLVGINHFTGSPTKNKTSLLFLSMPLWSAVHLMSRFMSHTATPVAMAETLDLVMYVFLAIYFMYSMMVISVINGKNPVKATIYWGAPAAVASLVYAVSVIGNVTNTQGSTAFDYLEAVTCFFMGVYILAFVAELSFKSKTKAEQKILDTTEASEAEEISEDATAAPVRVVEEEEAESAVEISEEDSSIELEINESTRKYFDDISSVESEIEIEDDAQEDTDTAEETESLRDYGSYFDVEEDVNMYIESENVAVDTTKKRFADKAKYPATSEPATRQHAARDEYVVGLDEVGDEKLSSDTKETAVVKVDEVKAEPVKSRIDSEEGYEARLDEIDRLIISLQGGDSE